MPSLSMSARTGWRCCPFAPYRENLWCGPYSRRARSKFQILALSLSSCVTWACPKALCASFLPCERRERERERDFHHTSHCSVSQRSRGIQNDPDSAPEHIQQVLSVAMAVAAGSDPGSRRGRKASSAQERSLQGHGQWAQPAQAPAEFPGSSLSKGLSSSGPDPPGPRPFTGNPNPHRVP